MSEQAADVSSPGTGEPGLYACVFQPPIPGSFAVPADRPGARPGTPAGMEARAVAAVPVAPSAASAVVSPPSPLIAIAAEFSPRYELHRPDLVSIDVRGLSRLFGTPRAIGAELRREAASRGVRVHVAIAPSRTAALVLSLVRPGVTVVPSGGLAASLADVSLTVLEQLDTMLLSGGRLTQARLRADTASAAVDVLRRWGLRTLGDLAALPAADLSARLGRNGRVWQSIARGEDMRPLVPMQADERFEGTLELEWPIEGAEPLSFVLTRLLEPLSTRLERRDRGAAVLHVELGLITRDVHVCRLELPSPLREVRALRTLALLDFEAHPPSAAIDRVTVTIEPTPGRIVQHALFVRPHPTPEQLSTLLARLGALMGQDRVGAPAVVDSYRPGAFAMAPFSLEHRAVSAADVAAPAPGARPLRQDAAPWPSSSEVRALHRDEDVHDVRGGAGPPAGPGPVVEHRSPVSALRRCRQPIPARVATDTGKRPLRVFTDRRGFAGGAVVSAAGPWRTSGAWWDEESSGAGARTRGQRTMRTDGSPPGGGVRDTAVQATTVPVSTGRLPGGERGPWSRDEWDVALADGAVYRIFRDRVTDGWFIDGVLD